MSVLAIFHSTASTSDNPTVEEWQAAAAIIQGEFQSGDGVRIHPIWRRDGAARIVPLDRRMNEPSGVIDLSQPPDPLFVSRHRRVWLVSAMGRNDRPVGWDDLVEEFSTRVSDSMTVSRYATPRSPILMDLLTQVPLARVERVQEGKPLRKCTWRDKAHRCNGRPWEDVTVVFAMVGGAPRRCIKLHPYPNNGLVRIVFEKQTLGQSLLFRSGITLEAARRKEGSDATVIVSLDGQESLRWTEHRNGWAWTSHRIDTADKAGTLADISIDVHALDEQFRDVCLDGYILSDAASGEHR